MKQLECVGPGMGGTETGSVEGGAVVDKGVAETLVEVRATLGGVGGRTAVAPRKIEIKHKEING